MGVVGHAVHEKTHLLSCSRNSYRLLANLKKLVDIWILDNISGLGVGSYWKETWLNTWWPAFPACFENGDGGKATLQRNLIEYLATV